MSKKSAKGYIQHLLSLWDNPDAIQIFFTDKEEVDADVKTESDNNKFDTVNIYILNMILVSVKVFSGVPEK